MGEITVEEEGVRISVRGFAEQRPPTVAAEPQRAAGGARSGRRRARHGRCREPDGRHLLPPAATRRPPFVEEGDPVSPGQVLCILEAMKLMNEVKAEVEAIVRTIHVRDGDPVEYGQLLFELEPLNGRPVGIWCSDACWSPIGARSPSA